MSKDNREQERIQAANDYLCGDKSYAASLESKGFIKGAEWSDEHPRKGLVDIEKVKEFLSSVDLNFYREWEDKFNTDELIVDLEKYLENESKSN